MTEQPANYAAISVQDSRMEADVESASSGTYSEAASPYWVPIKKAGEAEPQGFSGPVAFCFTINYILGEWINVIIYYVDYCGYWVGYS